MWRWHSVGRLRAVFGRGLAWALRPVLDELRSRNDAVAAAVEFKAQQLLSQQEVNRQEVVARYGEVSASLTQLGTDQQALSAAMGELQRHLEIRQDQTAQEVSDLRSAQQGAVSDLEAMAKRAIPELQAQVEALDVRSDRGVSALQVEIEALRDQRLGGFEQTQERLHGELVGLQHELETVRDLRLPQVEGVGVRLQAAVGELQNDVEQLRDHRLAECASQIDALHATISGLQKLSEEVRDERLPVLSQRLDVLIARLYEELTVVGGLVDRILAGEPLRVAIDIEPPEQLPEAMLAATRAFADAFRGSEAEIEGRVAEHLVLLGDCAPVLDLGCGRGELLKVLQRAGIAASGVDADPVMVASCRQAGLSVEQGEAVEMLRVQPRGSLGAVVALHLVEHLPAAGWMGLVEAAAQALRPGGVLLIESPNPDSLRVGAGLFWMDPTHRVPVHPDALAFVVRAVGLEIGEVRRVHEFPPEQQLARPGQSSEVRELAERLDAWLSAPRDFVLVARRPAKQAFDS